MALVLVCYRKISLALITRYMTSLTRYLQPDVSIAQSKKNNIAAGNIFYRFLVFLNWMHNSNQQLMHWALMAQNFSDVDVALLCVPMTTA